MPGITLDRLKAAVCSLKDLLDEYGVRFAPLLSSQDLERFECEHTVRLPEDYRLFLTLVGNGGQTGPCMEGLLPLGVFPSSSDPTSLLARLPDLFPFTEASVDSYQLQDSDDEDTDFNEALSYDSQQDMITNPTNDTNFDDTSSNNEYSDSENGDADDDDDDDDDKYLVSFEDIQNNVKSSNTMVGGYLVLGSIAQDRHYVWILICGGACRGEIWIMHTHGFYFPTSHRMKFPQWIDDWLTGGEKIKASIWDCGLFNPQLTECFRNGIDNTTSDDTTSDQEEDYDDDDDDDNSSNSSSSEFSYSDIDG